MISRFAGLSCKSILYCSPEHPPPTTATLRTPCGRPCLVSKEFTFFAALGLTLISRSSPTRKPGATGDLFAEAAIIGLHKLSSLHRQVNALVSRSPPGNGHLALIGSFDPTPRLST